MSNFQNRLPRAHESDHQIAEGVQGNRRLMCCADGCPNYWSVESPNGKCCSAHAWKNTDQWKKITRTQFDIQTERAACPPDERVVPLDFKNDPLADALGKLLQPGTGHQMFSGSKAWAYALKRCDEAGMRITTAQREMYKAVVARETIA